MTAPVRPAGVKSYGRDKWVFVATIANQAAPTAVECTAGTTLDVSLMFYADSGKPSQSTNRPTKPKRLGDTVMYEQIGDTTVTGGTLLYAVDPQAAAGSTGKKAYEKFPAGTTGYFVRRQGIAIATDLTAGQFVTVYPVELGPQLDTTEGDGETAEVAITQEVAVTGPPSVIVALV